MAKRPALATSAGNSIADNLFGGASAAAG